MRLTERQSYLESGFSLENEEIPKGLLEYPTFGTWKAFLNARPVHKVVETSDQNEDGQNVGFVYIKASYWVCVCCLAQIVEWTQLVPIAIGCLIRRTEATINHVGKLIEFNHSVMPVTQKGMGCKVCALLYNDEVIEKSKLNAGRAEANAQAYRFKALQLACGKPMDDSKPLSMLTPWIDLTAQVSGFGRTEWARAKEQPTDEGKAEVKASFKVASIPYLKVYTIDQPIGCPECKHVWDEGELGELDCPQCRTHLTVRANRLSLEKTVTSGVIEG